MVTALQLLETKGRSPPQEDWKTVNFVERDNQVKALRELRAELTGEPLTDDESEDERAAELL